MSSPGNLSEFRTFTIPHSLFAIRSYNSPMSKLSIGIVGLPNVGKSTLFNALLKKQVALAANYPFATIEPNVGVVDVPDPRLKKLAELFERDPSTSVGMTQQMDPSTDSTGSRQAPLRMTSPPIIPATVQFYDIAGLVKGASQGEGLGNQFLSHIREVSAILYVSRVFEDGDIIHVHDSVDPSRDQEIVQSELILADLQTLEKQNDRKPPVLPPSLSYIKLDTPTWQGILKRLKSHLNAGSPARTLDLHEDELMIVRQLNLLTLKPVLYTFNISENQLREHQADPKGFAEKHKLTPFVSSAIFLNAKLESDLAGFSEEEAQTLLAEYKLEEPGLNSLIKLAYKTLGLMSFLTAGEKEVRAWTIVRGTKAPQAAAEIHTDFEKHFIKADIVPFETFVACNGWFKAREQGKVVSAGRDYIMQEGDVVEFKVGV